MRCVAQRPQTPPPRLDLPAGDVYVRSPLRAAQSVQKLLPAPSEALPASQSVHSAAWAAEKRPGTQRLHAVAFPLLAVPASHATQLLLPSAVATFPASHCEHWADPVLEYVPGPHDEQTVLPSAELVPASHEAQYTDADASWKLPLGHAVQRVPAKTTANASVASVA